MTIREIKAINRRIDDLCAKVVRLRSEMNNVAPLLTGMPGGGGDTDAIGKKVAAIVDAENSIKELINFRNCELGRLSRDVFEENCIYLFLVRKLTWRRIATEITGRPDTADSIRMRCKDYKW